MTEQDLIDDFEFRAFCECWRNDCRCPIALPDWLRERGMEAQADAAQWALEVPDRWRGDVVGHKRAGLYPERREQRGEEVWGFYAHYDGHYHDADDAPMKLVEGEGWVYCDTFPAVIAAYLFGFDPDPTGPPC